MKKVLSFAAFLGVLFLIVGCHGRQFIPNFTLPNEFDETKTHNISFWAKNDSNPTQRKIYEKAIEDFELLYPNISVEIIHYTSYPDLYKAVLQNIGTNTTPNVAIAYPDHVAAYLESPNMIVRLDELIENSRFGLGGAELKFKSPTRNDLIEQYVAEGYIETDGINYLYTVPFLRSTEVMYVNKTWIVENGYQMPENNIFTWDQVWDLCRAFKADNPGSIPLIYQSSDNFFIELAYQKGNDFTTKSGDIIFDCFENKKMIQELNSLYKEGLYETKAMTGIYPGDRFNIGETLFGIDSSAGATWMGPNSPLGADSDIDFEVVVTTIPQYDVENPMVISQGPSLCLFNKEDPQEVLASWLFLQFLLTDEVQIAYCKTEGYSPISLTTINSKEFQDFLNSDEIYSVQRDAILNVINFKDYTFTTPAFNGSAVVRDQVGSILNKASSSKTKQIDINDIFNKAMKNCGK